MSQPAQKPSTTSFPIEVRACDPQEMWPEAERQLSAAVDTASWLGDFEALRQRVFDGEVKLLCFIQDQEVIGFCTVEVVTGEEHNVLYIEAMGGESRDLWLDPDIQRTAEALARFNKCQVIGAGCRPGAGRLLRGLGWRPVVTIMERKLDG